MQTFFEMFDMKNVTNDTELARLVEQAKAIMAGTSAEQLRTDEELKEKIRSGMEGITNQLSTMIQVEPGRMFREEDE